MAVKQKPPTAPPPDNPEQSARFVKAAEELEASSGEEFARAIKKIAPPHKGKKKRKPP